METQTRITYPSGVSEDAWAIVLEVVNLRNAREGHVTLPRRWVVERNFAWAVDFNDSSPIITGCKTLEGVECVAFELLVHQTTAPLIALS